MHTVLQHPERHPEKFYRKHFHDEEIKTSRVFMTAFYSCPVKTPNVNDHKLRWWRGPDDTPAQYKVYGTPDDDNFFLIMNFVIDFGKN